MQVKESRDADGWFDIRDELSAPTVVYVKWRDEREKETDKRNTNRALFEQILRRTRTAEKMTLGGTAVGEITRKESKEREREIREGIHMLDN